MTDNDRAFRTLRDALLDELNSLSEEDALARSAHLMAMYDRALAGTNCESAGRAIIINAWPLVAEPRTRAPALEALMRCLYYIGIEHVGLVQAWIAWESTHTDTEEERQAYAGAFANWSPDFTADVGRALENVMKAEPYDEDDE